jgi:hypothetical protein
LRSSIAGATWRAERGPTEDRAYHLGRRAALVEVSLQLRRLLGWPDPDAS